MWMEKESLNANNRISSTCDTTGQRDGDFRMRDLHSWGQARSIPTQTAVIKPFVIVTERAAAGLVEL